LAAAQGEGALGPGAGVVGPPAVQGSEATVFETDQPHRDGGLAQAGGGGVLVEPGTVEAVAGFQMEHLVFGDAGLDPFQAVGLQALLLQAFGKVEGIETVHPFDEPAGVVGHGEATLLPQQLHGLPQVSVLGLVDGRGARQHGAQPARAGGVVPGRG